MCGRYNLISNLTVLGERFEFDASQLTLESAYNIAPTQDVLTVIGGDVQPRAGFMRWGLIPFWAKDRSIGSRMINARAETVAEKALVPRRIQTQALPRPRRRFLRVAAHTGPASGPCASPCGRGNPSPSQAYGRCGRPPTATRIPTCAIITTSANELLRPIHHRMPVILPRNMEGFWLDRSIEDPSALSSVLTPYPDDAMEAYEVSTLVNSVANDGP